jgi:hypothetical protein
MSLNKFITKLVNQFVGEAITKNLAKSKAFQEFAQKTHHHVQKGSSAFTDPKVQQDVLREARKAAETLRASAPANPTANLSTKFAQFRRALGEEINKDLK